MTDRPGRGRAAARLKGLPSRPKVTIHPPTVSSALKLQPFSKSLSARVRRLRRSETNAARPSPATSGSHHPIILRTAVYGDGYNTR